MVSNQRLPFDPDSPGAQKLLRMMRDAQESEQPMDVVLIAPHVRIRGNRGELEGVSHKTGDRLTLPRGEGQSLIARGIARAA